MKVTCNVIKDLLPLYLENMLCDDSCILVEDHIRHCNECNSYLNEMKTFSEIPADRNSAPLKKIKSILRKKKIQTVIISVMLSLVFFVITVSFLTAPEYNPYSQKSVTVHEIGNGYVLARFDKTVSGYEIDSYQQDDNTGYVYHITTWNSIWNRKIKNSNINNVILNPDGEKVVAVYYYLTDGSEDILIFGKDINPNGGIVTLPRLFLTYYALIAAVFAIIFGLIMVFAYLNRKVNVYNFAVKIFFFPVSYLISHLAVKGLAGSSYTATRDLFAILLVTLPLYTALLMAVDIIRYNKNKKMPD